MSDYDVIVIGSGAGGGTLARYLAPSGKRILLLERGDWLPREPANWDARSVFVESRYVSPDTWFDWDGKAFQPRVHPSSAARRSSTAPPSTACAARTSGSSSTTSGSRPRGAGLRADERAAQEAAAQ
jgi:choline dehydrogenase-like flavoprotein